MRQAVPRAWDVVDAGGAAAFLAPDGLADRAGRLPLPCRVARLPLPPGPERERLRAALPPGARALEAAGAIVLAGPAASLREASRGTSEAARSLSALLDRYERRPGQIGFADGGSWDLGAATRLIGVLNVTPDSFSDGGLHAGADRAVRRAAEILEEGADGIDVGGESTRPGAAPVDEQEELARVAPVVEGIKTRWPEARVSIDTRRAGVARRALEAGADLVNDVSALGDPDMAAVVAARGCPLVLMHMRGTPADMQDDVAYDDLIGEILAFLDERLAAAAAAGIDGDRILVDPGFGFGKSASGNEEILRQLGSFRSLGRPILVGLSRKSFIGRRTGVERAAGRLGGSVAAATAAVLAGAAIVRAHDVAETRQALAVTDPLRGGGGGRGDRWTS